MSHSLIYSNYKYHRTKPLDFLTQRTDTIPHIIFCSNLTTKSDITFCDKFLVKLLNHALSIRKKNIQHIKT